MTRRNALRIGCIAAVAVFAGVTALARQERVRVIGEIPARIADTTFWRMFSEMSEPDGDFHSNNFVSNETELQHVIPRLAKTVPEGGVYIGVGPEQNLTYAVAFAPKVAFIVDIRRQNAMLHLMYKSLVELAADRADFLSMLFSRRRPPGVDSLTPISEMLAAFTVMEPDSDLREATMERVSRHLRQSHGFPVTDEDFASIEFVHGAFYEAGPDLSYAYGTRGFGGSRGRARQMPSFARVVAESDGHGAQRSFLASEREFRSLRDMHRRNVIIPLVGDFAGEHALRRVARWLRERDATLGVFYLSNVEQYLFQSGDAWRKFYDNVERMPRDEHSTFIRSIANRSYASRAPSGQRGWGWQIRQRVQPVGELLDAYRDGNIHTYGEVIYLSR
jgi:hypothetical protein